ncbi:MAG: O-methyltransferase [Acidobacteriota bacterium]
MDRPLLNPQIHDYLTQWVPARDAIASEMEAIAAQRNFPIIGPLVGQLLFTLARTHRAKRVFEMGSGFGYSTWWFSRAVGPEGEVVHTDGSLENSARAQSLLERAGLSQRVRYAVGDARELLARESGPFDVIFCDIDKEQYPEVPELAVPRLRRGGLLIFDNMLWSGRILDADHEATDSTRGVQQITRLLFAHPDLATTIIPLRDGVSVSVKL